MGSLSDEVLTISLGEASDDEVPGVIAEFADESGLEAAIEDEGVPMALVHVIAWENGVVLGTERDGAIRITFEVGAACLDAVVYFKTEGGEHLASHFINKHFRTKGRLFRDGWSG